MTGRMRGPALAAALALAALMPAGDTYAQPEGECDLLATAFGQACRRQRTLAPITDQDYGVVRLNFTPPDRLDDVIDRRAIDGSFLQRLASRTVAQSVRSAVVLLEVRVVGPELPPNYDESGRALGLPIATVPLALYEFDTRGGAKFSETQDFARNRVIGPRILLTRDETVRARVRIVFTQQDPSSLLSTLAPVVRGAAAFGATGFVVNTFANDALMSDLSRIESTLRSVNNIDAAADNWIDLDFNQASQLEYSFQINPSRRGEAARPQGRLVLTLERRPSLFTDDVLAGGDAGRRLPDYRTDQRWDSQAIGRLWTDPQVRPGVSPEEFAQDDSVKGMLDLLQDPRTPVATFDGVCRSLRNSLNGMGEGLSRHDRTALFWAAFVQGGTSRSPEHRQSDCIQTEAQLWSRYRFALPDTGPPPPRPLTAAERDEWLTDIAIPALTQRDESVRGSMLRRLLRETVMVNVAPNTLFEPGDEPGPNTLVDRTILATMLRPMRVGCRFVRQEDINLPRFSLLGRLPANNRLLVISVDYGPRASGASRVEITGLQVRAPQDSDWDAIEATTGLGVGRCVRTNPFAPSAPPDANLTSANPEESLDD
ncbi:MAG: hypothetical protein AB7H66_04125 [Hyphomonadaceae bacterium]